MIQKINIRILVAPLDWGLGHATRCIPLIRHLVSLGCNVIIATEGAQEKLLKTEFPELTFVHLPGYQIRYSRNKRFFAIKIIAQLPKIFNAIRKEKRWLKEFVSNNPIDAVISDNRYGLHHHRLISVFITHQLTIKAPIALGEKLMQQVNYRLLKKFNDCWIPDVDGKPNLAGILSHPEKMPKVPTTYLGGVSRFNITANSSSLYALLVVISGPEPQRTALEQKLLSQLRSFTGKVMFVRGLPIELNSLPSTDNIVIRNHLNAAELQQAFINSKLIISRSGYTTVMDICKLQKKSILIPTPGQTEQEYLAQHLENQGWCMWSPQDNFQLAEQLTKAENFRFLIPELNMETYKSVVENWVDKLK